MNKLELAKWLHDNYEEIAKKENWNTQKNCKVEFDTLSDANKRTMIEIAERLLNFNLLRLHFDSNNGVAICDTETESICDKCGNWSTNSDIECEFCKQNDC